MLRGPIGRPSAYESQIPVTSLISNIIFIFFPFAARSITAAFARRSASSIRSIRSARPSIDRRRHMDLPPGGFKRTLINPTATARALRCWRRGWAASNGIWFASVSTKVGKERRWQKSTIAFIADGAPFAPLRRIELNSRPGHEWLRRFRGLLKFGDPSLECFEFGFVCHTLLPFSPGLLWVLDQRSLASGLRLGLAIPIDFANRRT